MTAKFIAVLKNVDCFSSWESILLEGIAADSDRDIKEIEESLEYAFGCTIIHSDSIATDMKIEAFVEQLKENPYQLNLL
jgi:hypothetical protein